MKLSKDGWSGLAVLAASLILFGLTLGLKDSPLVPIGPGFYPRLVLGLTAVLAAAVLVLDFLRRKQEGPQGGQTDYRAVILHFGVFGLYALALPWLGFRVATFVYVATANAFMAPPRGWRQWVRAAVLGLVTSLATYYVFEHYLHVLLPRGRWTGF